MRGTLPRAFGSCLVALACLTALSPQQETAPGIRALVERIQERYEDVDLQARFVQNRLSRLGSVMISAEGQIYISTPGRMRFEYETDSQLFVAGGPGRESYQYYPDDNTVQVIEADASSTADYPILYLSGRGNLRRDFDYEVVEWGRPLARGNVQLEFRPRRSGASFERLILEVEPLHASIVRLITFDNLRNTIEYQFHDIEFDVSLSDELFEFEIPEGADVVIIGR